MAVKLNLLPEELKVSKSVLSVVKVVKPLNVVLLGVFLAGSLGMAVFFVFSSITLRNLTAKNNSIIREIQAHQSAQQQVVLIKDRLEKARKVFALPNAQGDLQAISPYVNLVGANSEVTELDLNSQGISVTLTFRTNGELSGFMKSLGGATSFSKIYLNSFSFTPGSGYLVGITFVRRGTQ